MSRVKPKKKIDKEAESGFSIIGYVILCPACDQEHLFYTNHPYDKAEWSFNGDFDKPTFDPSLSRRTGHFVKGYDGECWCDYNEKHPDKDSPECGICHSRVTDGKIHYYNDSTHELAGQTIELPDAFTN